MVIFLSLSARAQKFVPDALRQQLQGKTKLADIMAVVDTYYGADENNSTPNQPEKAYIHWKRWEWWMSSHLDGNGNFVPNINRFNHMALTENDRMWNAEIERALQGNTSRTSGRTVAERELAAQAAG